mmetsp:Transcript_25064/g.69865  ORF Transcript_25064/g.69865 Transcript_25064/m.69865 type:complete len:210 (-) Transcript_25064:1345-1974(-)
MKLVGACEGLRVGVNLLEFHLFLFERVLPLKVEVSRGQLALLLHLLLHFPVALVHLHRLLLDDSVEEAALLPLVFFAPHCSCRACFVCFRQRHLVKVVVLHDHGHQLRLYILQLWFGTHLGLLRDLWRLDLTPHLFRQDRHIDREEISLGASLLPTEFKLLLQPWLYPDEGHIDFALRLQSLFNDCVENVAVKAPVEKVARLEIEARWR